MDQAALMSRRGDTGGRFAPLKGSTAGLLMTIGISESIRGAADSPCVFSVASEAPSRVQPALPSVLQFPVLLAGFGDFSSASFLFAAGAVADHESPQLLLEFVK